MLDKQIPICSEISLNLREMQKVFFAICFLISTVFYKVLYMKKNVQKQPHQLSASVILAGGLTIYKEDII